MSYKGPFNINDGSDSSIVTIATITPATDADVTLTLAQYNADVLVIETGAWTTARNIIVPDESRSWQVISNSAHAATVKTAAGTGVAVPAGQSRPLVCNGTNVVDPLDAYYEKSEIAVANSAPIKTALNASGAAPIYACRAWVNFNGTGTVAIRESRNVSSITDNGTGDYTVNFTTALPDANYALIATGSLSNGSAGVGSGATNYGGTPSVSNCRIRTHTTTGSSYADGLYISVSIFR